MKKSSGKSHVAPKLLCASHGTLSFPVYLKFAWIDRVNEFSAFIIPDARFHVNFDRLFQDSSRPNAAGFNQSEYTRYAKKFLSGAYILLAYIPT